jgi:formylglycine-generating enzyme required for sulfatase activity
MAKRMLPGLLMLLFLQPAMAQRKYNKTDNDPVHIYMVSVQGGSFDLGSNDGSDDRKPAHTVKLSDFSIGEYEVTQAQWKTIMGDNPSTYQCDECPVTNVSWDDVQTFIGKLNEKTGKHYRLPTEAEWEYAARGGNKEMLVKQSTSVARGGVNQFLITQPDGRVLPKEKDGKKYSGKRLPGDVAWFERNGRNHVHCIGRKKPNELGIYDMSGNAEEWCGDHYASSYGNKHDVDDPKGPASGTSYVVRGGSYTSDADELVVTRRSAYTPDTKASSLGFRLVLSK